MWKSAYVGVYQLLIWNMHGETLNQNPSVVHPIVQAVYRLAIIECIVVFWLTDILVRTTSQRNGSYKKIFSRLSFLYERQAHEDVDGDRGELSYLAPLGSENISAPYFKQCFFRGGG